MDTLSNVILFILFMDIQDTVIYLLPSYVSAAWQVGLKYFFNFKYFTLLNNGYYFKLGSVGLTFSKSASK